MHIQWPFAIAAMLAALPAAGADPAQPGPGGAPSPHPSPYPPGPYYYPPPPSADASRAVTPPQAPAERTIERTFAIEGNASFGGPYGLVALALDVAPIPYLALNVGVGTNSAGPQLGAMGRLRIPLSPTIAIGFEGGVSTGAYHDEPCRFSIDCQETLRRVWDWAVWRNLGINFERRSAKGFHLRAYLGNARLLNPGDYACDDTSSSEPCQLSEPDKPLDLIYMGVGLGYAFDL